MSCILCRGFVAQKLLHSSFSSGFLDPNSNLWNTFPKKKYQALRKKSYIHFRLKDKYIFFWASPSSQPSTKWPGWVGCDVREGLLRRNEMRAQRIIKVCSAKIYAGPWAGMSNFKCNIWRNKNSLAGLAKAISSSPRSSICSRYTGGPRAACGPFAYFVWPE